MRRVVCTGIGLVTPFGIGRSTAWDAVMSGKCAIQRIQDLYSIRDDYQCDAPLWDKSPCQVIAAVPRVHDSQPSLAADPTVFNPKRYPEHDDRTMPMSTKFGLIAAKEALDDANLSGNALSEKEKLRTGVSIGCAMMDIDYICEAQTTIRQGRRLTPFFIPRLLTNMAAGHIGIMGGYRGPCHSVATACATGSHAIGDSFRFIQNGSADVMIAGGIDSSITYIGLTGFVRARALSTMYNSTPQKSSRPFDKKRDGFVMSEGAGVVILEELERAKQRGAKIYGEVVGYGLSGDAHHITSGREDGEGGLQAMNDCLRDHAVSDIWFVNAHSTSTPRGDIVEMLAIDKLMKSQDERQKTTFKPYINSFKGHIGHMLGAAGAVESALSLMSLQTGQIAPSLNCEDREATLDGSARIVGSHVSDGVMHSNDDEALHHFDKNDRRRLVLKNSFGFGGTNVSLLFKEFRHGDA